jgi:hypothetical protein
VDVVVNTFANSNAVDGAVGTIVGLNVLIAAALVKETFLMNSNTRYEVD